MSDLSKAFRHMRKLGFIARQNFSCCSGCAGSQIATELEQMSAEQAIKVVGVCYYHKQDADDRDAGRDFYISFGQVECASGRGTYLSPLTVGELVCHCLRIAGVKFEWEIDPKTRIKIFAEQS